MKYPKFKHCLAFKLSHVHSPAMNFYLDLVLLLNWVAYILRPCILILILSRSLQRKRAKRSRLRNNNSSRRPSNVQPEIGRWVFQMMAAAGNEHLWSPTLFRKKEKKTKQNKKTKRCVSASISVSVSSFYSPSKAKLRGKDWIKIENLSSKCSRNG